MDAVIERFIELSVIKYYRPLNRKERLEYDEALKYLVNRLWKLAKLKELSYHAYITNDKEWYYELCAELEKLEGR